MAASDEDVKNEGKKSPVVLIAIIGVVDNWENIETSKIYKG